LIFANELDVSLLEWSKLFDSDDEERQPVHWKNVVADQDAFRAGLLAALGIDARTWAAYWHEMKKYRDTHVAHHDPRRGESLKFYPKLDLALATACYYYDHVRNDLRRQFSINQQPSDIRG